MFDLDWTLETTHIILNLLLFPDDNVNDVLFIILFLFCNLFEIRVEKIVVVDIFY